ncbi:tmRNA (uracil-C(5))-methyltransferase [Seminavis robusta]|uniref:TmRNA (Uracil-C(5))-methyltransferase n=1 Tax=Seminavis robusta TaxID=568900 RepID=A0A9N8HS68_9STRA|nr:tmRNA (uracil-C(5))-methyltransferase [Seminavis robusta]|eukprot:Sro1353_g265350.1 tmRNA (uracil-C(5))-methyltransferase (482) ;mRNA; r:4432-5877
MQVAGTNVVLPGYESQLTGEDAVLHSQRKLQAAAANLERLLEQQQPLPSRSIVSLPCTRAEETVGYRCKCSFQLLIQEKERDTQQRHYQYAMRYQGQAEAIGSPFFPIANPRIQRAMQQLLELVLNNNTAAYPVLVNNESLTSLTFAASWGPDDDRSTNEDAVQSDCIVTLNYDAAVENADQWIKEAHQVCQLLNLTQLHGRSRKILLSAIPLTGTGSSLGNILRDTIYLIPPPPSNDNNIHAAWKVSLATPQQPITSQAIAVHYHKPETAFFHPNANVMCQALAWMLERISLTATSSTLPEIHLLEMYCGCGAHTMALAKSNLLTSIMAVELDQRLVDACKVNVQLNNIVVKDNDSNRQQQSIMSPVQVVRGDAGQWAHKNMMKRKSSSSGHRECEYSILLVDPPRQGLDKKVVDLAIHDKSLNDMLIISCGHEALVRDLKLLGKCFDVINCRQLDLFPRTDSVETLVHLRRRLGGENKR